MSELVLKCLLISDFTINPLEMHLKQQFSDFKLKFTIAPIDQVRQSLAELAGGSSEEKYDITIIWTKPEKQILEFKRFCDKNIKHIELIQKEVEEFGNAVTYAAGCSKLVVVPSWTNPAYYRGNGVIDLNNTFGIKNVLMRMNLKLADTFEDIANIYLLDADSWLSASGRANDEKMWYMGKIPFSRDVFMEAALDIKTLWEAASGKSRKLIVVDLDNTLWGGIIGDDDIGGIKLGGIDPVGEAFVDFQKSLLSLKHRGILLAICSKNEKDAALNAIEAHSEMILKSRDFAAYRINWKDKAENILDIVQELNIGLQAVVFIDDNPAERARVREALPEVLVPEWPEEPIYYRKALNSLRCFDVIHYSEEDRYRTKLYHEEKKRRQFMKQLVSMGKWLFQMELKIHCETISEANFQRVAQLINKTNQFNLITRRMEQAEILGYCTKADIKGICFRADDKFGKYGIVGVCVFRISDEYLEIEDFVLSCRAMGKGVEKTMLYLVKNYAVRLGKKAIYAKYIKTAKNKPCEKFLPDSGFVNEGDYFIHRDIDNIKKPDYIEVSLPDELPAIN